MQLATAPRRRYGMRRSTGAYKPVLIMHGILAAGSNMNDLAGFIRTAHPGTQLYIVDLYDYQVGVVC